MIHFPEKPLSPNITFNSGKDANFGRDNCFLLTKGKFQIHLNSNFGFSEYYNQIST